MPSTSVSDMPTLASPSKTPSPPFHRRRKSWARKVERCCCSTFTYFPLLFVYGLTTWAVCVEVKVSFVGYSNSQSYVQALLGVGLYLLANVSYSIAVFTRPGSPSDPIRDGGATRGRSRVGGYEDLPTYEDEESRNIGAGGSRQPVSRAWVESAVTAKSTGKPRYCKKCKSVKPDRTHHCSTCQTCVLKMDHHCPWLATCVGLRNYKAFILFLIYTSVFCWTCFLTSAWWVWSEFNDQVQNQAEGMLVVNTIMLSVLGGIIGLVLSGFTGWHIYLVMSGQTTIESLEKNRYMSPLKKSMERQLQDPNRHNLGREGDDSQPLAERLKEIHANALPGVLRPEEGDSSFNNSRNPSPIPPEIADQPNSSPAHQSMQRSYASMEAEHERDRYQTYLDEVDSEKLPNAFDLGWKRNFMHVLGEDPKFWLLPVLNTTGDGWQWETSPKFHDAKTRIAREREQRAREEAMWNSQGNQPTLEPPPMRNKLKWQPGQGFVNQARGTVVPSMNGGRVSPSKIPSMAAPMDHVVQMQPLDRRQADGEGEYDTSSEEEDRNVVQPGIMGSTNNWNDVPDDYLMPSGKNGPRNRSRSRGRRKGD